MNIKKACRLCIALFIAIACLASQASAQSVRSVTYVASINVEPPNRALEPIEVSIINARMNEPEDRTSIVQSS
jgi:hypothetical protein